MEDLIAFLVVFGVPVAIGLIAGCTAGAIAGRWRRDSQGRTVRLWACGLGILGSFLGGFLGMLTEAMWEWIPIPVRNVPIPPFEQLLLCGSIGAVAGAIAFASLGAFIGVTISTRPGTRSRTSSR